MFVLIAAAAIVSVPTPHCEKHDLLITFVRSKGSTARAGDRHDLLLRNVGPHSCTIEPFPTVTLYDPTDRPIDAQSHGPAGMSPGPAVFASTLRKGGTAVLPLRWPSPTRRAGKDSRAVRSIGVELPGGTAKVGMRGAIVAEDAQGLGFEQMAVAPR